MVSKLKVEDMQIVFNFQLMRQLLINENNLQQTNDITIIKGCQRQQSAAQRALFEKYSGILFATCYRYVGNQADAKDTLQESFIRIFKYFKKFDPQKGSLKSWMIRICINESLKKINSKKTFEGLENLPIEPIENPIIFEQLQMKDLIQLISQLPLPYRTFLNLFLVEGYSHAEIAEQLNIQKSNSRAILSRAKGMLKKKLVAVKI